MLLICTRPGWRDAVVGTLPWGLSLHGSMADWGIMTPVGTQATLRWHLVLMWVDKEARGGTENKFTHPALQHTLIALSSKSINVLRYWSGL